MVVKNRKKKSWSLQVRMTLCMAVIVVSACLVLTSSSILSALRLYSAKMKQVFSIEENIQAEMKPSNEITFTPRQEEGFLMDANPITLTITKSNRQFSVWNGVMMAVICLLSILLTYIMTGRTLKPLKSLKDSIGQINEHNLQWRVPMPGTGDEVGQLTGSFNDMLDRLAEAFSMQKRFAANAAHELKTPLALMKTSLDVLRMDEKPSAEDYDSFVEDMEAGIDRLTTAVESLSSLTLEAASIRWERIYIQKLLNRVGADFAAQMKAKKLEWKLYGTEQSITGNYALLYRMFTNLVDNAVKYSKKGGAIKVTIENADENNICIQVQDTGLGMNDQDRQHMFEPFFRADPSRSQRIPGAGLGLSIVKTIVDKHEGEIEVESSLNQGTLVRVILPRTKEEKNFIRSGI
ncbi:HAMP domain-containing sensor histidine kinase [Anaerolentibacter hominis]|uniref:sensor histidine kinase n=1 Tax=Anaerolentibacter hominis TaxID=3079009 RepID=UPI0031B81017